VYDWFADANDEIEWLKVLAAFQIVNALQLEVVASEVKYGNVEEPTPFVLVTVGSMFKLFRVLLRVTNPIVIVPVDVIGLAPIARVADAPRVTVPFIVWFVDVKVPVVVNANDPRLVAQVKAPAVFTQSPFTCVAGSVYAWFTLASEVNVWLKDLAAFQIVNALQFEVVASEVKYGKVAEPTPFVFVVTGSIFKEFKTPLNVPPTLGNAASPVAWAVVIRVSICFVSVITAITRLLPTGHPVKPNPCAFFKTTATVEDPRTLTGLPKTPQLW
jgi:predicted outer membrane lipoprotein